MLRGSSSSTVAFTWGSRMRSLCSHVAVSSRDMSVICGKMISADAISSVSRTLGLPRESELWGRRTNVKQVMSRAVRKPWILKLSRKSGEGKIGKITTISPLCCSPPLPSSLSCLTIKVGNTTWLWPCWGVDLGNSGFLLSTELDSKASQVLEFPFPYTPTATAFVMAVSRVVTLCIKRGWGMLRLLSLAYRCMNSLSSAGPGQAAESLSRSLIHKCFNGC